MHSTIKGEKKSRLEMAQEDGQPVELPDVVAFDHLPEAMMRLGPVKSTGMGERPADWPEIDAFARATGRIGSAWEAETLFDMCRVYMSERQDGGDPFRVAPVARG